MGGYDPNDPDIAAWKREMRGKESEGGDDGEVDEVLENDIALIFARQRLSNWKAPGPDGIPGYWLKCFPNMTRLMELWIKGILNEELEVPDWVVEGRTVQKRGAQGSQTSSVQSLA